MIKRSIDLFFKPYVMFRQMASLLVWRSVLRVFSVFSFCCY